MRRKFFKIRRSLVFSILILGGFASARLRAVETIPLAGQWGFELDRADVGTNENWFSKKLLDKIQLPGVLEAQGYGDEISAQTPWVLTLYDHAWFLRADYAACTNAGSVKVPFLCQPPRHYLGAAWYQRDFEIPADWNGKRIVLFLERPHWKSTVWLDDKEIGSDISLCTPHEFDFGLVPPGKHHLTIRVDNRMILPYRPDAHSISDSLDDAWNGIVGKIELRATPTVWVDSVEIFPDAKNKNVHAWMTFHNLSGKEADGKISFFIESRPGTEPLKILPSSQNFNTQATNSVLDEEFNLGDGAKTWDEFCPALYKLQINTRSEIGGNVFEDNTETVFGLRDFHADGNQFILNGHPIYIRGTHSGGDFPLTGYPPTDVAAWRKIFRTCKDWGLNSIRFHSWCPPEAAFEAADELGFYLYIEPGMWNTFNPGSPMEAMLYSETERILKAYGNHPSFVMFSPSNEPKGRWQDVLPEWAEHFRAADPRHLYTSGTGFTDANAPGPLDKVDFTTTQRFGNRRVRGESGWFGGDYADSLQGVTVPVITHEVGQWAAYPDFDVIKKFTGFMQPRNYEIFRDSAAAHGLLEQDKNFAFASGKFQLECYKEEIEANLRTPGLSGFQLLDLHDYVGQGSAFVGLLDTFWESKGYATPEEFKKFCNAVVPLARLKQRVFTTADKLEVPVEVANFGESALTNASPYWWIVDSSGDVVTNGVWPACIIPIGKNFPLGKISVDLSKLPAPQRYKLVVWAEPEHHGHLDGLSLPLFRNDWNFWLYPAQISGSTPADVLVTSSWDDAEMKLAAGGKVLFLPRNSDLDWTSPPLDRVPIFWNRLMNPNWTRMLGLWCDTNHPMLATFPTDENCDWQWTELLRNTRAVNLDHLPKNLQPIVSAIDDWNRNWKLGLIFEAKTGAGKLVVCSIDLGGNPNPVAQQLRRSLLDYMAGDKFRPKAEISMADFDGLHFDSRIMRKLGATIQADGQNADALLDGDPNTFWATGGNARGATPIPFPHGLTINFPQPVAISGLVLMPRQNDRDHLGDTRGYKIETSDDGSQWKGIARGELASTWNPQRILFGKTITAKEIKFTALSGFGNDTSTALAEMAVIYAGPKLPGTDSGQIKFQRVRSTSSDVDEGVGATNEPAK